VYDTTLVEGLLILKDAAVDAASRASFECHGCSELSTPHTMTFVFALVDGPLPPPAWKQTGDASSEVTVFGEVPIYNGGPSPPHLRAARCLWLWHCGKAAYLVQ
jgi:hypothetical protein